MESYDEIQDDSETQLALLASKFKKEVDSFSVNAFHPTIKCKSQMGNLSRHLAPLLADKEIFLLVMADHDKSLATLLLDNNMQEIIETIALPILIIPQDQAFKQITKIAFATDLRNSDIEVLASLVVLARPFQAEIMLAHICADPSAENVKADIDRFLNEVSNKIDYPHIYYRDIQRDHVKKGLQLLTEEVEVDLLVMVHRDKGFFTQLFNTSNTEKIAAEIQLPLLVYNHPEPLHPIIVQPLNNLNNMSIQTKNPSNNQVVKTFAETSPEAVEEALVSAERAFALWRKTDYEQRAELLHMVAMIMRERKEELAATITLEMGKLIAESRGEIDLSADIFDYYAINGENFLDDKILNPTVGEAYIRHSPIGVLLGVEPWNFPFYQMARFAAPNIMIGNVVLVKHASNVPQCGIAIEEIFKIAGAKTGVYTNLLISGARASELAADDRIKGVSLTGSEAAGSSIAAVAGKNLKKSVLELGGNDAFIVLEDADIDQAVNWAVIGRMNNTGQCCVAAKRFIVVEAVADEFLSKFKHKIAALKVGDPMDAATQLGPLSSEKAAADLADQVQRSVDAGAKVALGGKRLNRPGAFMEATILTDLKPGMAAYEEELFGPVASFYRVKDEQEAIVLANDSPFGLGGSVFTNDIERGKRVADQIDTGMVFINHPTWTAPDLPFGGTKRSGYGRELSSLGIDEFVNKKLIRVSALTDGF